MAKRVLVVDDHPAVALALKLHFRRDGRFEVADSATTAAGGLRRVTRGYAAVLLDLHLPDLSGVELIRAFRERAPEVPLIVHSAADDTPAVDAVRGLVDAVTLKTRVADVLAALERVTGPEPVPERQT
jgi:DNA-binding NarL/FixJ family response regulator